MKKATCLLAASLLAMPTLADTLSEKRNVKIPAAPPANAAVFSTGTASVRLQVLAAAQMRTTEEGETVRLSVRDMAQRASMKKSVVNRPKDMALLLLNGGFSGSRADRPAGLLISSGKTVSIPSYAKLAAEPDSACPHLKVERFKLSGLICARANGELVVGAFSEKNAEGCKEAIQAGPVLIDEQAGVSVCSSPQRANRTAICISRRPDGKEVANFVVTDSPISLFELATWMASRPENGGLGCYMAVNLSGDDSTAAAFYSAGRSKYLPPNFIVGEGTFPQASFLAVTAK